MWAVSVIWLLGVLADRPLPFPLADVTDAGEVKLAARRGRSLQKPGGLRRAVRHLCATEREPATGVYAPSAQELVTSNFLIEHGDRSFPLLLGAASRAEDSRVPDDAAECGSRAGEVVKAALCFGFALPIFGDDEESHPLAIERRALARRALVAALGGARARIALDILINDNGVCPGLPEAVREATPALVALLGSPRSPARIPRLPWAAEDVWERAFRALSEGGADAARAEAPVRTFLAHDETAALASLTLARMGVDARGTVPQLARILGAGTLDPPDRLSQLSDALDALEAIGKPASRALPAVGTVARLAGPRCSQAFGAQRIVSVVRAIAAPADAGSAVAVLAPLLACPGDDVTRIKALGEQGAPARAVLAAVLRDHNRTIPQRLAAADGLGEAGRQALPAADRQLVSLLQAKRKLHQYAPYSDWHFLNTTPDAELPRCRAEVGLPPLPLTYVLPAFGGCLAQYLCGPTREHQVQTLERCCGVYDRDRMARPSFCQGLPDAGMPPSPWR